MPPTFFLRFFAEFFLRLRARLKTTLVFPDEALRFFLRFLWGFITVEPYPVITLRAGFLVFRERGRWEADDFRRFFAEFCRRFPPNPAAICFLENFFAFAILPAFRPGFAMIVSLVVTATGHPLTSRRSMDGAGRGRRFPPCPLPQAC